MAAQMRGERLQIMLTADELRALDDFRFRHRMPSRAAAVRQILKHGLASNGAAVATGNERSSDFGVLEPRAGARRRLA